jgi:hypothetical protein
VVHNKFLTPVFSTISSISYYTITSFVYSVKMADDDRFASISEGEMDAIVENTGVKNLL